MTAVEIIADEAEWLAARRQRITASDVAMARTAKYGGAVAVVAGKLGHLPPVEVTAQMDRGHRWEAPLADAVHALTGLYVVGEQAWITRDDLAAPLGVTVDGLLADRPQVDDLADTVAVLELKTTGTDVRAPWAYYLTQVQYQLAVTGLPRALVAAATIDDTDDTLVDLRLRWVDADPFDQEQILDLAADLWAHVQAGTLPDPVDPSELDAVKAIHAHADPDLDTVDLSDLAEDLRRRDEVKAAVKAVEDELAVIDARIRARLGAATKGTTDTGWRVSLSAPARVLTDDAEAELLAAHPHLGRLVLDRARAKELIPDQLDAARRPAGARRLTITPPRQE